MTRKSITPFGRHILATTLSLLLFSYASQAQSFAAFAGRLQLKQKITLSGKEYSNSICNAINFTQTDGKVNIERTTVTPGNTDTTTKEELPITGKTSYKTGDNRTKTAELKPGDANSFTESGSYSVPGDETKEFARTTEVWTLSDAGKTLTVVRTFQNLNDDNDKWSVKGIFEK